MCEERKFDASTRLRMMRALAGIWSPKAASSAVEAASPCETGHTPQMRWVR